MEVLMYGWEFPPYISGGLGTACYGIVTELINRNIKVSFVLPNIDESASNQDDVNILGANQFCSKLIKTDFSQFKKDTIIQTIKTNLNPYATCKSSLASESNDFKNIPIEKLMSKKISGGYGKDLLSEVLHYAFIAGQIAKKKPHDIIHAHDWLTILAGVKAKQYSGKPLIFHTHALEPNRSGKHVNKVVFDIEKYGMEQADKIVAVSQQTKNMIIKEYGIDPQKIVVIYNGIFPSEIDKAPINEIKNHKMVLFLGRITYQKAPFYFIDIAKKVLEHRDVEFVIAGNGDMAQDMIEYAASLRIGKHVHFTGFLDKDNVKKIFRLADIYIMPSVSEPFGISCLEALSHHIPTIISKQSGAAEVLNNALIADFWDVEDMASKVISLLDNPSLGQEMVKNALVELKDLHWDKAAEDLEKLYQQLEN